MSLHEELGLKKPFKHMGQVTLLNIIATSSLLISEGQNILSGFGLTLSQLNVLMMLKYQSENGRLNQTELGNMLLLKRSGLTGLVDRMEKAGLVRRIPDPDDRRVNLVEMTDEGKQLLDAAEAPYFSRIEQITQVLSEEDHAAISLILEKIRTQLT